MAHTAFNTTDYANGQQVLRNVKRKDMAFTSPKELEDYILELLRLQTDLCALTDIPLNLDEVEGDPEMRASLDRIDSNGHYERGNLQIVCRFINRWKGASENDQFRRLMEIVMRTPLRRTSDASSVIPETSTDGQAHRHGA